MGKFDKYKIDLKGMQADSCKYEFVLDNLFFANIDGPEVQKGKVNVVLVVKKTSRAFELNFQTDGMVWVPCDRCLDDMEQPVSSTDKLLVKFGHEYAEEGDNLIVIPEEEGEINVAWFMYEFIALAIPMKHVHAPSIRKSRMTKNCEIPLVIIFFCESRKFLQLRLRCIISWSSPFMAITVNTPARNCLKKYRLSLTSSKKNVLEKSLSEIVLTKPLKFRCKLEAI